MCNADIMEVAGILKMVVSSERGGTLHGRLERGFVGVVFKEKVLGKVGWRGKNSEIRWGKA